MGLGKLIANLNTDPSEISTAGKSNGGRGKTFWILQHPGSYLNKRTGIPVYEVVLCLQEYREIPLAVQIQRIASPDTDKCTVAKAISMCRRDGDHAPKTSFPDQSRCLDLNISTIPFPKRKVLLCR